MIEQKIATNGSDTPVGLFVCLENWSRLELLLNVDFLSGSLFVILAIPLLGDTYGVFVGLIAITCNYFLEPRRRCRYHDERNLLLMRGGI